MSRISDFLPDYYDDSPERFFWPVQRDNLVAVRDRFVSKITNTVRHGKSDNSYADFYGVFCLHWTTHVIKFYHFLKPRQGFQEQGEQPFLSGDSGFFQAIVEGRAPETPAYIDWLYRGIDAQSPYLAPIRFLKSLISGQGILQKPTALINFQDDVVLTSVGPLMFKHAAQTQESPAYVPRSFWFKPIKATEEEVKAVDCSELIDFVRESFADDVDLFDDMAVQWFSDLFSKSLYACDVHVRRLLDQPKKLPHNLWIGSGGVFWDRILKYAVSKNGGHVTTHDHGSGVGHVKSVSRTIAECNDCDIFIPFAHDGDIFKNSIVPDYLLSGKTPKVQILKHEDNRQDFSCDFKLDVENTDIKKQKILIVPYGPDQNTARFLTTPHDSVKVDFLVRTLKQLRSWGYAIAIKPHPHCPEPLSSAFLSEMDVRQVEGDIKKAFAGADIVLFFNMYTSTFREAFECKKPMVLIDMGFEEWVHEAKEKLDKRCAIVDGAYDDQARILIDWGDLRRAIETASTKTDNSYYKTYYSFAF